MNKKGKSFWDTLAWIILALITLWVILKMLGFINTPIWLQYSPLFGAIYLAGWTMKKLDTATDDIKDMKVDMRDIEKRCYALEKNV